MDKIRLLRTTIFHVKIDVKQSLDHGNYFHCLDKSPYIWMIFPNSLKALCQPKLFPTNFHELHTIEKVEEELP